MSELNARIRDIEIPRRMRKLPISSKGFPVPWFVSWLGPDGRPCKRGEGEPDFRVITPGGVIAAHNAKSCWLCGEPLGTYKAFIIGPMCAVNRVSAEPPSHLECAQYAVKACPFLAQPRMRRNAADLPDDRFTADGFVERNPGATVIWVTQSYQVHRNGRAFLFNVGKPLATEWYREGRPATRAEIMESIESGLPTLRAAAERGGPNAIAELEKMLPKALALLPAA